MTVYITSGRNKHKTSYHEDESCPVFPSKFKKVSRQYAESMGLTLCGREMT